MTLAVSTLSCRRPLLFRGWNLQSPVATWKHMQSGRLNEVITFATKKEKEKFSKRVKGFAVGAPRSAVLQACTLTSGLLLAGGLLLRQASHLASLNGWPIADPTNVSFNFETWHLELVAGLVIVISSSRYILLQTWSDFRDSSEAANRQILTSLEPLDYIVVACLPGISEELIFRGAMMPILGLNWISALIIGTIFGVLHLGNGRKYSFAIWATFVGFAYGIGTIASSSIIVPMASHSINNIIGGLLWCYTKNSQK